MRYVLSLPQKCYSEVTEVVTLSGNVNLTLKTIYNEFEFIDQLQKNNGENEETKKLPSIQLPLTKQKLLLKQLQSAVLDNEELLALEAILKKAMTGKQMGQLSYFDTFLTYYLHHSSDYIDGTMTVDEKTGIIYKIGQPFEIE